MLRPVSSTVNFWAWRIQCLILVKACSIGLRSGIRSVGRQVPKPGTGGGLDHLPDSRRIMASKIVHDDDIAELQHSDELLLDIGAEALAFD